MEQTRRFQQYQMKNNAGRRHVDDADDHHDRTVGGHWFGKFRTGRSTARHSAGLGPQPPAADWTVYRLRRRRRRQTTVLKQNFYRLLEPETARGFSPLGGVARMLLRQTLTFKNKTEKDVVQ